MKRVIVTFLIAGLIVIVGIFALKPSFDRSSNKLYGRSENFTAEYITEGWRIWYVWNGSLRHLEQGYTEFIVNYIGDISLIGNGIEVEYTFETNRAQGEGTRSRYTGNRLLKSTSKSFDTELSGDYYIRILLGDKEELIILEEID